MTIIRQAVETDATPIARVHVESWRTTYAGLLPDRVLLNLNSAEHESRWWRSVLARQRRSNYIYVAEHERHGVIGFGSAGPSRDNGLHYRGEVYTLYLDDAFHGEGIGRQMFTVLSERLVAERGPSMVVWVLNGNPSRYFYEALGGRMVARRRSTIAGAPIEEVAYGWEDARTLVADRPLGRG